MDVQQLSPEEQQQLKKIIDEGVMIKQEVKDRQESLKDLVKDFADKTGMKAKEINKAIAAKFKDNLQDMKEETQKVEDILEMVK
jgi:hypothetical protein